MGKTPKVEIPRESFYLMRVWRKREGFREQERQKKHGWEGGVVRSRTVSSFLVQNQFPVRALTPGRGRGPAVCLSRSPKNKRPFKVRDDRHLLEIKEQLFLSH